MPSCTHGIHIWCTSCCWFSNKHTRTYTHNTCFVNFRSLQSHESQCVLRTPDDHDRQCAKLEEDPTASREYGINSQSILNDLWFFHTCSGGLIPDIMHDVLEGVFAYETKIMLKRFIQQERYLQLADLSQKIEQFELGYTEVSNRPTPIAPSTLTSDDNSLKKNGMLWQPCICMITR